MNLHKFVVLVNNIGAADLMQYLIEEVGTIAPNALIVTNEDLMKTDPSLIGRVEIIFGSLGRNLFPQTHSLKWPQTAGAGME